MPKEIENLLEIARIKSLCKKNNIIKVVSKKDFVVFTFEENKFDFDVNKIINKYGNKVKFSAGIKPMLTLDVKENSNNVSNINTKNLISKDLVEKREKHLLTATKDFLQYVNENCKIL